MTANRMTLCDMHEGDRAIVTGLRLQGSIARRLQELGLIEGTSVVCCRIAPGGSPAAYRVRGAMIALRSADARWIDVGPAPE